MVIIDFQPIIHILEKNASHAHYHPAPVVSRLDHFIRSVAGRVIQSSTARCVKSGAMYAAMQQKSGLL